MNVRYQIRSIIPSETLHIEDDSELTPEMRSEAKRMVESEQLRRRDPQAHQEMIRAQRAQQIQSVQEHTRYPVPSVPLTPRTKPMPWGFAFSSGQKLPFPSTAPTYPTHMGGLPMYNSAPKTPDFIGNGQHSSQFASAPRLKSIITEPVPKVDKAAKIDTTLEKPDGNRISPMRETLFALTGPQSTKTSQNGQEASNAIELSDEDLSTEKSVQRKETPDTPTSRPVHEGCKNSKQISSRKHSLPAEGRDRYNKKFKWAPSFSPKKSSVGSMEAVFQGLLEREGARSNERNN